MLSSWTHSQEQHPFMYRKRRHVHKWEVGHYLGANIDGLVQDCSNSSALAIELLQSCTKPLIYSVQAWCIMQASLHGYFSRLWKSDSWTLNNVLNVRTSIILCSFLQSFHSRKISVDIASIQHTKHIASISLKGHKWKIACIVNQ